VRPTKRTHQVTINPLTTHCPSLIALTLADRTFAVGPPAVR
jgi:hypothetical protein